MKLGACCTIRELTPLGGPARMLIAYAAENPALEMGFLDESNTGVAPGVTLTPSGSITIDTAGAVVSGLDITDGVVITAPNVMLENCRVAA
jgi:hypothetical protein